MVVPMPEEEAELESARAESQARLLEGVRLAARTLEHHLTNHLTLTVGYAELIAEDPEVPERVRDVVRQLRDSARAAVDNVRRLGLLESLKLVDQEGPGGPLLELSPTEQP